MNELGDLLRKLRGKKSLRDVADETNLSHSYIADLEKGYRRGTKTPLKPSFETLKRLSEVYNYDYNELLIVAGYLKPEENNGIVKESKQTYIKGIPLTDEEVEKYDDLLDWIIKEKLADYKKRGDKSE